MKMTTCSLAFLAAASVQLASAATDENGLEPTHWYKFDGDRTSYGSAAINFDGGYGSLSYVDSASGQALQLGDPWCSGHATVGSAFTVVTEAKSTSTSGKHVLWGRGDAHNRSVGLYAEGNTVGFFCWDNTADKLDAWHDGDAARVLVSTTVDDATSLYHSYAVVYSDGVLSLYVDGARKADTSALENMISFSDLSSEGRFQFGSMHGALGGGMSNGSGCFIDDYRYYSQALSGTQLTAISSSFSLRHHYKFDGNLNSSGAQALGIGGLDQCVFVTSPEGQALAKSDAYCGNHAGFTSSFSIVVTAKSGAYQDARKGVIWARGTKSGNVIGLYLCHETAGLFTMTGGADPEFFATTTVADARTAWHSYGVVFEEGKLNLYVDGEKSAATDVLEIANPAEFVANGYFQIGSIHGGTPSGMWKAYDARALIDDYRYYTASLSAEQLRDLAAPIKGQLAPSFDCKPTFGANSVWGWTTGWEYNGFVNANGAIGPADYGIVYSIESGENHGGSGVTAADKRSFAVYANLERLTFNEVENYYTLFCIGGSVGDHKSVNLCCYKKSSGEVKVKAAYIKGAAHDGGTREIDVTGLKGYHLFAVTYDSAVGTTLSMDGATPIADTSDKAKFVPTSGLQVGATWEGKVFRIATGAAIAEVLGYDKVLTADEIAALANKFPATQTATTDIDVTNGGTMSSTDMTVAAGKYIGVSNGTWEIPEGVEVQAERVRCMNRATVEDVATLNLAGTLTINADGTSANVYGHGTGVLLGHYRGVGTYNITGTLDASRAYVELRYSAADQTVNVDGGTLKAKGVSYVDVNGATGDVLVNLSNGATVEVTEATGFQTPCAVLAGNNTLKVGTGYTYAKALSIAENASLTVEVAPEQTMTFGEGATVSGAGAFRKAGEGSVVFTTATAPQKIALAAGTVTVPATYAGTVKSVAKGQVVGFKMTDEGILCSLGDPFVILIR